MWVTLLTAGFLTVLLRWHTVQRLEIWIRWAHLLRTESLLWCWLDSAAVCWICWEAGFLRCSGHQPVKLMAQTLVYNEFQSLCSTSSKRYGIQHGTVAVKMRFNALGTQWSTFSESKSQECVHTAYSMLTKKLTDIWIYISWVNIIDVQKLDGPGQLLG